MILWAFYFVNYEGNPDTTPAPVLSILKQSIVLRVEEERLHLLKIEVSSVLMSKTGSPHLKADIRDRAMAAS